MKKTLLLISITILAALAALCLLFSNCGLVVTRPLSSLPAAETCPNGESGGFLLLSCGGEQLPVFEDKTVLVPVLSLEDITVTALRGGTLARTETEGQKGARQCTVFSTGPRGTVRLTVKETGLASARLLVPDKGDAPGAEPVGTKKQNARFVLFREENGRIVTETVEITVKQRGSSSLRFAKKSYTLTMRGKSGYTERKSLFGFPADTKFALNSLYEDDVKIRDAFGLGLYADIAPDEPHIGIEYCELFINGAYWGLYGFQQVISPESLGLEKNVPLVKINGSYTENLSDFGYWTEVCADDPDEPILPALKQTLERIGEGDPAARASFDAKSAANYMLFIEAAGGADNVLKNMVLRRENGVFKPTVYDTDLILGLIWGRDLPPLYVRCAPESTVYDPYAGILNRYNLLPALFIPGEAPYETLVSRYRELRGTLLSDEALLTRARTLYGKLRISGALLRDHARWPESGFAQDLSFIERYIPERMRVLDARYLEGGGK